MDPGPEPGIALRSIFFVAFVRWLENTIRQAISAPEQSENGGSVES